MKADAKDRGVITKRMFVVSVFSLVVMYALIAVILHWDGENHVPYLTLDKDLTVDVRHLDGSVEHSDSNYYSSPVAGETVVVHVPLDAAKKMDHAALCFGCYNAAVRVYFENQVLLKEGVGAVKPTGHLICNVPLPQEAWGKSVRIELYQLEDHAASRISHVLVLPAIRSYAYPLLGQRFGFLVFGSMFSISVLLFFYSTFMRIFRIHTEQGMFFSFFCLSTSVWYLGFQGMLYLMIENRTVCAYAEYAALYMMPIPFFGYMRREPVGEKARRLFHTAEKIYIAFFLFSAATEKITPRDGFITLLTIDHILLLCGCSLVLFNIIRSWKKQYDMSSRILYSGIALSVSFVFLEIFRVILNRYNVSGYHHLWMRLFVNFNFAMLFLLTFTNVLILSYIFRTAEAIRDRAEENQLKRLAYLDILTGIPNRLDCEKHLSQMEEEKRRGYTLLFFDVDHLKKANDTYGHQTGDVLIKATAEALKRVCEGKEGFYGRFGGDEFLACFYQQREADQVCDAFMKEINRYNEQHLLPFAISVSVGRYDETENQGVFVSVQSAIRIADTRMYANKQMMGIANH